MHSSALHKPITSWAAEDRPREKMISKGTTSLTDTELVAMLLGTGTRNHSAIDLARHLVARFGGLTQLSKASVQELMQVQGIGQAKATTIIAGFELARRRLANEQQPTHFAESSALAKYLIHKIGDKQVEVFYVIYLDRQNQLIAEEELFKGGVSTVAVDGRYVFRQAINNSASSIVIAHNHPSGRATPSKQDDLLTEHLLGISEIACVQILDHIIVSSRGWYSYADQGLLQAIRIKCDAALKSVASSASIS